MSQLDLVVDAECFVASTYALDVRIAKPLLNGRFFTIVSASRRRSFHLVAVLRSVASIVQESPPHTSPHASRHHRLRSAPSAERVRLTSWCVWQAGNAQRMLRWLQAERDAAGAGPHGEQAGARAGPILS